MLKQIGAGWILAIAAPEQKPARLNAEAQPVPGSFGLACGEGVFEVVQDRLGAGGVFIARHAGAVVGAASDPALLAALFGAPLDRDAIFQDLFLGFRLGRRSVFANIERLLPRERLFVSSAGQLTILPAPEEAHVEAHVDLIEPLAQRVAQAFDRGAALELTGGVDSRLVLALGQHAKSLPRLAFTIGHDHSPDVRAAHDICHSLGIRHVVIDATPDHERLADDARAFARRSGFASSAAAYGWLPSVFRRLDCERDAQIGGVGGETAEGFYYTPADQAFARGAQRLWVRLRLVTPGVRAHEWFSPRVSRGLRTTTVREAVAAMQSENADFRKATDAFYLHQRLRSWAGPVMSASRCWYEVLTPLLSEEYLAWGAMLPEEDRADRRGQRALLKRLAPGLDALPWASAFTDPTAPKKSRSRAQKIWRRLAGTRQPPEVGSLATLRALLENGGADQLRRVAAEPSLMLREDTLHAAIASPEEHAVALGFLFTAAFAQERRDALKAANVEGNDA